MTGSSQSHPLPLTQTFGLASLQIKAIKTIAWRDVEALFIALGAEIPEGNGSRVRVVLKDVRAVFHRPHPRKETNKGAVKSVRRFLEAAGVKP